jgi:hypothetical protein
MHCGVYYLTASSQVAFLHFGAQSILTSDDGAKYYLEIHCPFPDAEKKAISNLCRYIFKKKEHTGLRYTMNKTDSFSPKGNVILDEDGTGFTCGSFVKNVFRDAGYPILDETSWPPATAEDLKWAEDLTKFFRERLPGEKNEAHYDAIDPACPCSRFRPEEVAASLEAAPPPAQHALIKVRADELAAEVKASCTPIPLGAPAT